jgi:hypothetical protein
VPPQNHGYDSKYAAMRAIFVAHGPFSAVAKAVQAQNARRGLWNANEGWHATADDTYVMNGFENVNVYGLAMKLLGLEEHAAPTNGTRGFWDQYF